MPTKAEDVRNRAVISNYITAQRLRHPASGVTKLTMPTTYQERRAIASMIRGIDKVSSGKMSGADWYDHWAAMLEDMGFDFDDIDDWLSY